MTMKPLSKSKYLNGLQCLKYLWVVFNAPEQLGAVDAYTQFIFDQGHQVGELAKKLLPDGINISTANFIDNIAQTKRLLKQRKPLFEAGILINDLFSRVDMLVPAGDDEWDIVEVKMSTEVKPEHIQDASFQRFCCEKNGMKIRNCSIAFINNNYVRHGEIDPKQIFKIQEITREVNDAIMGIAERIAKMFDIVSATQCPSALISSHCKDPNPCPVTTCWDSLPDNTILELYYGGKKKFELFHKGIFYIKDVPADVKLSKAQKVQQWCDANKEAHHDDAAIKDSLGRLEYPVHYLDFETFNTALPMFDNVQPYQQVPFQFSLHIVKTENAEPVHYGFLADCIDDPRPKLLEELRKALGETGSVVVYNQTFEKKVLEQAGETFPEYREWAKAVCDRLVDLLTPFKDFCYYNPKQKGSTSLKQVLPAITEKSYEGMPISEGNAASLAYLKLMRSDVSPEERVQLRADLEKYCGLDTEGMVWIVDRLKAL
jgi:hypothetical protein